MTMGESEAKRKWMKENTVIIAAKLYRKNDNDILDYLQGKQTATVIKAALREYMQNHPAEVIGEEPPPWLDDELPL